MQFISFILQNYFLTLWKFYIIYPNSTHLQVLPYSPQTPAAYPPKLVKNKTKRNKKPTLLLHLYNTSSFLLVASGAAVCHSVYAIVH